jgi:hypothetical protein
VFPIKTIHHLSFFRCQPLHFLCGVSSMYLIPPPPRPEHRFPRPYRAPMLGGLADRRMRSSSDIRPGRGQGTSRHRVWAAACPPVEGSSFDFALFHGPARAYCGRSPAWELHSCEYGLPLHAMPGQALQKCLGVNLAPLAQKPTAATRPWYRQSCSLVLEYARPRLLLETSLCAAIGRS